MKVSYNELHGLCRKAFQAMGFEDGDAGDAADMVAWMQLYELQGLAALNRGLRYLLEDSEERPPEIIYADGDLAVLDSHGHSVLKSSLLALELGFAKARARGLAVIKIQHCHNRQLIMGYLARLAGRGMNVTAFWRNAQDVNEAVGSPMIEQVVGFRANSPVPEIRVIVLSAPIRHASLVEGFTARLRETVAATPFAEALGSVTHRAAGDQGLHELLAAAESGGMPHVIWLSVDSLLFDSSVSELSRRGQLAYASRPSGLFPGEAVAALLFERLAPDSPAPLQGWQVPLAATLTHPERGSRELRRSPAPLMQLIERHWPVQAGNDEHAPTPEPFEPMRLVIDSLGLPGRAVEAGTSLMNRWPGLDMIEDGTTLDSFCGWPGDAWLALALVLAIAELEDNDSALVVSLRDDTQTRMLTLTPCAG
ncbi:DUF3726 domain-containing protein [Cobetia crustatorum]|uniref:DUF3726 domain-containing protein n=1 Tax=Cobetia crustatorum TaxID=553385 RepID=UPI0004696D69|nr:DUF3726 domain-containing protein [Cobetia crustatorum]